MSPLLSPLTIDAVQAEALRAHLKHGNQSLLNPDMPSVLKLAALIEEVGEAAAELTYDKEGIDPNRFVVELIQVASVALSWVESLEGARLGHETG